MRNLIRMTVLAALIATPAVAHAARAHQLREAPVALGLSQAPDSDLAIKNGFVMGRDPDSNVRFELRRDNPTY